MTRFSYKTEEEDFRSLCLKRSFEVKPFLDISVASRPSMRTDYPYAVDVQVQNSSETVEANITGISTMSPVWQSQSLNDGVL